MVLKEPFFELKQSLTKISHHFIKYTLFHLAILTVTTLFLKTTKTFKRRIKVQTVVNF